MIQEDVVKCVSNNMQTQILSVDRHLLPPTPTPKCRLDNEMFDSLRSFVCVRCLSLELRQSSV